MRILRMVIVLVFLAAAGFYVFTEVNYRFMTDHTAPEIMDTGELTEVSIESTEADFFQGITATDNKDGDVTSSVVVLNKSEFINKGTFNVTFAAFDQGNNVGTYTKTLTYTDYTSPRFSITKPLIFTANGMDATASSIFRVEDCIDGDISGRVNITTLDNNSYNTIPLLVDCTNSCGENIAAKVMIMNLDSTDYSVVRPYLDEYVYYVKTGTASFSLGSHIIGVWSSGSGRTFEETGDRYDLDMMSKDVSDVDFNTPGCYVAKVIITYEENDEVKSGYTYISIVVED